MKKHPTPPTSPHLASANAAHRFLPLAIAITAIAVIAPLSASGALDFMQPGHGPSAKRSGEEQSEESNERRSERKAEESNERRIERRHEEEARRRHYREHERHREHYERCREH
jgi:hypothetical protein